MKNLVALLFVALTIWSCDNSSGDSAVSSVIVDFKFTHTWNGTPLDDSSLNNLIVTNANGEEMTITRLRYMVSRLQLVEESGRTENFNTYKFTDLSQPNTYNFTPANNIILGGTYTLNFIWGLNEEDNIDGAYPELNAANWNWPAMLGGGYHFLQMDGFYNVNTTPSAYNFHNGTARVSASPLEVEQNFAVIELNTPINLSRNTTIEVIMDISEFFKNPNTWDLNVLDTPLMPNYNAQKMMQQNVQSVFSIGEITQ